MPNKVIFYKIQHRGQLVTTFIWVQFKEHFWRAVSGDVNPGDWELKVGFDFHPTDDAEVDIIEITDEQRAAFAWGIASPMSHCIAVAAVCNSRVWEAMKDAVKRLQ